MEVKNAILDILAYWTVFRLPLAEAEINQLLHLKTGHLAVRDAVKELLAEGKLRLAGDYLGLKGIKYANRDELVRRQTKLLAKARRWSYFFRLLPFIKAVVVVNSASFGNVTPDSDIDLLIVTKPNRIYLAKAVLMYGLRFLRQLETSQKKAGRFSLGMFLTTAGVDMKRDMMKTNEPHLCYWLAMAKPVYGASIWYGLLKKDGYAFGQLPNYVWPKTDIHVYANGLRWLDPLDDRGYRVHLKHTSRQPKTHTDKAFVRVRPDIINLHALDKSGEIAEKYHEIRARYS